MTGSYQEDLPFKKGGGSLHVSGSAWSIFYSFPGPDGRYNPTYCRIEGRDVDKYVDACRENWNEYENIKDLVPSGGDFSKPGKGKMTIHAGSRYWEGIGVFGYHLILETKAEVLAFVEALLWAKRRASEVSILLGSLR